jgi:hypothetical protein
MLILAMMVQLFGLYADTGNDGAAFRTAFPMTVKEDEEE